MTDGSLDTGRDETEGWYDRAGEVGLLIVCKELVCASSLVSSLLLKRTFVILAFGLFFEIELSTS